MVLAADDAVFGLPEVDTGIFPMAAPLFFSVQSGSASGLSFSQGGTGSAPRSRPVIAVHDDLLFSTITSKETKGWLNEV